MAGDYISNNDVHSYQIQANSPMSGEHAPNSDINKMYVAPNSKPKSYVNQLQYTLKDLLAKLLMWVGIVKRPLVIGYLEVDYRKRCLKLLDYYHGDYKLYLQDVINKQYANPKFLTPDMDIEPVVPYVVNSVANTFKNGLSVVANDEKEQDCYDKIVDSTKWDLFIKYVEKYTFLLNMTFIKVNWRNGGIEFDLITPEYVQVEQDSNDPQKVLKIAYPKMVTTPIYTNYINFVPIGQFHVWSPTEYLVVDNYGQIIPNAQNIENKNPYNIIPIVPVRRRFPINAQYMQWIGEEMEVFQDNINILKTEIKHLAKMQAAGYMVVKNPPKNMQGTTILPVDPSVPIVLLQTDPNVQSSVEFISPDAKIETLEKLLEDNISRFCNYYGISPADSQKTAQVKNAETVAAGNVKLEEYREQVKVVYAYYFDKLFEVVRVVWNTHAPIEGLPLLSDAGVHFDFEESKIGDMKPSDLWLDRENKLKYNLETPVDWVMQDNKDLDYNDAIAKLNDNAEFNALYSNEMATDMNQYDEQGNLIIPSGSASGSQGENLMNPSTATLMGNYDAMHNDANRYRPISEGLGEQGDAPVMKIAADSGVDKKGGAPDTRQAVGDDNVHMKDMTVGVQGNIPETPRGGRAKLLNPEMGRETDMNSAQGKTDPGYGVDATDVTDINEDLTITEAIGAGVQGQMRDPETIKKQEMKRAGVGVFKG